MFIVGVVLWTSGSLPSSTSVPAKGSTSLLGCVERDDRCRGCGELRCGAGLVEPRAPELRGRGPRDLDDDPLFVRCCFLGRASLIFSGLKVFETNELQRELD